MKLKAHNNYVAIEVDDGLEDRKTSAGLWLPQADVPQEAVGTIVSVGPSCVQKFEVGQRVLFPPYGIGEEVFLDGKTYFLMLDHQILGVVNDHDG